MDDNESAFSLVVWAVFLAVVYGVISALIEHSLVLSDTAQPVNSAETQQRE